VFFAASLFVRAVFCSCVTRSSVAGSSSKEQGRDASGFAPSAPPAVSLQEFLHTLAAFMCRYPLARHCCASLLSVAASGPFSHQMDTPDGPCWSSCLYLPLLQDLRTTLLRSVGSGPHGDVAGDALVSIKGTHINQVVEGAAPALAASHVHALIRHRRTNSKASGGASPLPCADETVARMRSVVLSAKASSPMSRRSPSSPRSPRLLGDGSERPPSLEAAAIQKVTVRSLLLSVCSLNESCSPAAHLLFLPLPLPSLG
jgi:hypothetical protein